MNRETTRLMTSLLAGAAAVALATGAARAADGPLVQAADPYFVEAQDILKQALAAQPNTNRAKNVILFVGDGMGISTVTAARIFEGQQRGVDGVSNQLAFDAFPHVALSKTYSSDAQVTDSAPSATAMMTGVKLKNDMLGVNAQAIYNDCASAMANKVTTLVEMAELAGMSTGAITTTRHHPRHSGRHLLPHAEPRLGGRRRHEAGGDRRRLHRHRPPAGRDVLRRRPRGRHGWRPRALPARRRWTTPRTRARRASARTART